MEGYEVIVELKTGKRHQGHLASADDNMNLMLEEEQQQHQEQEQQGEKAKQECTHECIVPLLTTRNIRGPKIRYVHFPDNANLSGLVRSGRERERNASKRYQKTKRARK